MHTRPNVYMDEVLLGGKRAAKFQQQHLSNSNHHHNHHHQYHQSATSISNQDLQALHTTNMRNRQRKWRVLLSIGLLLPALAAIIGIVAWTISIEVASANEATQQHRAHNNHHQKQQQHHHSSQSQPQNPVAAPQQRQPSNQNEQKHHKRHEPQPQQQPQSVALPQQAAETSKSESQACATLVLTNLKQQQLDLNGDNIEKRTSSAPAMARDVVDDTSSYETDEQPQEQEQERDQDTRSPDSVGSGSSSSTAKPQPLQDDDSASYEAIASAISTTLVSASNGGASKSSTGAASDSEPSSSSALKSSLEARRTTGENVADVIDQLVVLGRRRQASSASTSGGTKARPNVRGSRIVVVAPGDSDSMRARSQTKEASGGETAKSGAASKETPSGGQHELGAGSSALASAGEPAADKAAEAVDTGAEQRSAPENDSAEEVEEDKVKEVEEEGSLAPEVVSGEPIVDRGEWVPAWPLRRMEFRDNNLDDLSIHVSSQPKEARARSRRQEVNPASIERSSSSPVRQPQQPQQQRHQPQKGLSSENRVGQFRLQQQPKLFSTEQIIRDHVTKSKSRQKSSQAGAETSHRPDQDQFMVTTMQNPPAAAAASQQQQTQLQHQHQPRHQQQPQRQHPQDLSRQQQQLLPSALMWQQQQQQQHLVQQLPMRPQQQVQEPQRHFHDIMGSGSSPVQLQQVPQFPLQPKHHLNPSQHFPTSQVQPDRVHPFPRHLHNHQQHQQQSQLQAQPRQPPGTFHTTEHHFMLSPSQFRTFMNSPLFRQDQQQQLQQQPTRPLQVASSRNSFEGPAAAAPSMVAPAAASLPMISEHQTLQQQEAAGGGLSAAGSEPRAQVMLQGGEQAPAGADQEVQESYGQMPTYQMAEGGYEGGHGAPYPPHHGGYGGGYAGDQDKKSKGITFHFGGGPIGGGTQLITSPMGIFKHLMLPLLPNPRVNLNGKVVFGVVLEKSTAFGSPPKKRKYKFWGR